MPARKERLSQRSPRRRPPRRNPVLRPPGSAHISLTARRATRRRPERLPRRRLARRTRPGPHREDERMPYQMSVEIMAAHRAPYHDPDAFGGTPEERSEAISTYLSYSGPFEMLADQDTVIHHIEVCSYPNWIGNAQVRFAKLSGDLLTLSTKPMTFQGVERTAELVWERVGHD